MRLNRTKNASRNIFFGLILKIYQVFVPFIMRTAMIYLMGVQYLGLNSLFTSILQVLNLAELGVGSAMVYSMYEPITKDDNKAICALLRLYKKYYYIIGLVIAIAGTLLTPFIPKFIKGSVPDGINIYILYLLNLGTTVLSYWLFAYKTSILQAHQRTDILSKVMLVTNTVQYALQFGVLYLFKSYYLYIIVALVTQAVTNILTALVASHLYPDYKPEGKLDNEETQSINQKVKDLFTSKIGAIVVNSADTIVISTFLGLTTLAVYQNYYFILSAVIGFVDVIFVACTAGIGNSLILESKEKNFKDLMKFTFIIAWVSGTCVCCFLNLYQPFMTIWVGSEYLLDFNVVICFCIYFFIYEINRLLNTYKDAGGIWHSDRFRPLVTALTNLGMNLIMVQVWGIYGIILSTVLSMLLVGIPWILNNLFTSLFEKKQLARYFKRIMYYVVASCLACTVSLGICSWVELGRWTTILIRLVICIIVPNCIFIVLYHKFSEFKYTISIFNQITIRKSKFSRFK